MTILRGTNTRVRIRISAKAIGFILQLPLLLLIIFIPSPIYFKTFFIGLIYLLGMIGFGFDIWWTRDLFEKKIFGKENLNSKFTNVSSNPLDRV
jgi:hypothetical protein